MILKLQNAGKFITTSGSGYIPPSRNIIPSKKSPTAATINQWLKGTFSYITGIKDSDLIESKYRPSKETNTTTKYYTRKGLDYDVMRNLLGGKESSAKTFEGEPLYYKNFNDLYNRLSNKTYRKGRLLRTTDNSHLGEYTIGIGEDNNGRYVSYYDKFDWAPNEKLEIFSPYEIYNRIYEKDFNRMLKELNNETYSGSNPSGNWFFKSGMNNKGYFKFGGKTANARKWKHESGGILRFLLEGGKNAAPSNKFLSKGWFKLAGLTINGIANNVGDFFGTDLGKGLLDVGKGLFNGYLNYKSNSSAIESQLASGKASLEETYQNAILEAVKNKIIKLQQFREKWKEALANGTTNDNFSDIVASHFGLEEYNSAIRNAENLKAYQLAMMELQAKNAKGSLLGNMFGSVVLSGLGALGGIIGNKGTSTNTSTNTSTPTLNFFNSPSIQTKNAMAAPSYNFNTGTFNTKTIGGNLNF